MSRNIEKTFEVAVSVERAWNAFVDADELVHWQAPEYEIDAQPGGKLRWRIPPWPAVDGEVLEVEEQHRLRYTEGEGVLEGRSEVTVVFEASDTGTRITIVHAGFGDGAHWQDQLEGHSDGWARSIQDLVLYLETGVASRRFFTRWQSDLGMYLTSTFAGMQVLEVVAGGWAEEAGVEAGDLILYVDGSPIFARPDLWPFHERTRAGTVVEVEVARGAERVRGRAPTRAIA